jgi:hypothetical protein
MIQFKYSTTIGLLMDGVADAQAQKNLIRLVRLDCEAFLSL